MHGDDRLVVAQAILQIDAEIAEKGHPEWKRDRAPDFESRAAGSNPAGRTNYIRELEKFLSLFHF